VYVGGLNCGYLRPSHITKVLFPFVPLCLTLACSSGGSVKEPLQRGSINSVHLLKAVLCTDCECISESRTEVCGVCGGRSLVNLGRLLKSTMQSEAGVGGATNPPISPRPRTLADSARKRTPHRTQDT